MFEIALENFPFVIVLVILAGSLLGSTFVFIGGGAKSDAADDSYAATGYHRPADWPSRGNEVPVYEAGATQQAGTSTRRSALPAIFLVMGLAFVGGFGGLFAYKTDWPIGTDVRHLVATLHCDLAERVGLAPAQVGSPGYHIRNDRDRNGTSCEIYAPPALDLATGPVAMGNKLSTTPLTWSDGAAVPASE